MTNAIVSAPERPGLNEATFIPRLKNIEEILTKGESVISMLGAIRELDKRAVILFEIRNGKLPQTGKNYKKYSILNPEIQKLVYSYNSSSKDTSPILIEALKKIGGVMIQEVQKFLKQWDIEESGEKQAIILGLVQEGEKKYDEAMKLLQAHTFQPLENDVFREKIIQLGHFITQHSSQETEELVLRLGSLSGNKNFSGKIIEWTGEKISQIIGGVKDGYIGFKEWDRWLISYNKLGEPTDNGIPFIRFIGVLLILQQSYINGNDYIDGQWGSIEDLVAHESQKFGEGEGERKYGIIKDTVFPVLARHIHNANVSGYNINYSDWRNGVFYFGDNNCLKLDLNWAPDNITYGIWDKKEVQAFDEKTGQAVKRTIDDFKCDLPISYISEIGVGNNMNFFLDFINHPESITEIRRLSENLFIDGIKKD